LAAFCQFLFHLELFVQNLLDFLSSLSFFSSSAFLASFLFSSASIFSCSSCLTEIVSSLSLDISKIDLALSGALLIEDSFSKIFLETIFFSDIFSSFSSSAHL
jgi:hypothetical protein